MGQMVVQRQYNKTIAMAGAPAFVFQGAVLTNSALVSGIFTNNVNTPATWNQETLDTDGLHSIVSNTNQIVIPAALNGKTCVFHASVYCNHSSSPNTPMGANIQKSAAGFIGYALSYSVNGYSASNMASIQTAPVVVATGEIYDLRVTQGSGVAANLNPESTFTCWVIA